MSSPAHRLARPRVLLDCVANDFSSPGERIIEFSFPNGNGGLISLSQPGGRTIVEIYRTDQGIEIMGPERRKIAAENKLKKPIDKTKRL